MSLGGATTIRLAATRPDLVRRAVVIDVTPSVNKPGRVMTPEQRGTVALVSGHRTTRSRRSSRSPWLPRPSARRPASDAGCATTWCGSATVAGAGGTTWEAHPTRRTSTAAGPISRRCGTTWRRSACRRCSWSAVTRCSCCRRTLPSSRSACRRPGSRPWPGRATPCRAINRRRWSLAAGLRRPG